MDGKCALRVQDVLDILNVFEFHAAIVSCEPRTISERPNLRQQAHYALSEMRLVLADRSADRR